ncbi:MAG TPA: AAA family ATPase [Patescibacteria group bacterium]|nr:AAA family ATPase [Patescibacteria group bacterium]
MKNNKIITLVGMTGSGKSLAADYLQKQGFGFVRFGQVVMDELKRKNLEPTEENEKPIREQMRKDHGMAAMAVLNIPKFDKILQEKNLVADGLYSWSEYKKLKQYYQNKILVVAIFAPPETRYKRLAQRKIKNKDKDLRNRPATYDQAHSRDYAEIENIEKGGPIAMADHTIVNTKKKTDLFHELDKIIKKEFPQQ